MGNWQELVRVLFPSSLILLVSNATFYYKFRSFFRFIRKEVLSDGATGKVAFDDNGDRIFAEYDIINIQENGERVSVGQYFYPAVSESKRVNRIES